MYLFSRKIIKYKGFICGMLTGNYGLLEFNKVLSDSEVKKNRKKYLDDLGINLNETVFQEQKHSSHISIINLKDRGRGARSLKNIIKSNDGMISNEKNLFLCSFSADCVPVSLFDPGTCAFGMVHSGWRGTLNLITKKAVEKLKDAFGTEYAKLICYLGPSIKNCCYEVSKASDNRIKDFENRFGSDIIIRKNDEIFLDLQEAIRIQLQELGVLRKNIEVSNYCTCCSKEYNFPSFYRDRGNIKNSILSITGIRN